MISSTSDSDRPRPRVVPEHLPNRSIGLDNKKTSEEDLKTVEYSVGGSDQFFYETDYLATYQSTLVTIENTRLIVNSDECSNSRDLSLEEQGELTDLILNSLQKVKINDSQKSKNGCGFPRFVMDSKSTTGNCPCPDFEIYYSSDSSCIPEGELIISGLDSNGDSDSEALSLMNEIKDFFKTQIDLVCPSS